MDAAELRDDDLHDKRMTRLKREREEKEAMKAEIERLQTLLDRAYEILGSARSGNIAGSREDMTWDRFRADLLGDIRAYQQQAPEPK